MFTYLIREIYFDNIIKGQWLFGRKGVCVYFELAIALDRMFL